MNDCLTGYFRGANTPQGFVSLFGSLYNADDGWSAYILKGGPGTGKSGLLKSLASSAAEAGLAVETAPCSSDPLSLDAVILPEKKICVVDGTAPHVIEPEFPGAVEQIINLGDCWDTAVLRANAKEIIKLCRENSSYHSRCVRFLDAAASLRRDILRTVSPLVDSAKLERYASRLAARELPSPSGRIGREERRFLSAVTPLGVYPLWYTVSSLCKRVVTIADPHIAAGAALIDGIRAYALGAGVDIVSCLCPLDPNGTPEHILIPSLSLAFVTSNDAHPYPDATSKELTMSRFYNRAAIKENLCRLGFCRRSIRELVDEAVFSMKDAKAVHDKMEAIYGEAMDFAAVDSIADKLYDEILSAK